MVNLNKNRSLNELRGVIQKSVYERINVEEQNKILELFNQRVFLEKTIDETIAFNKKLTWDVSNQDLQLTTTAEELIEVFKLRSDVYTEIKYQDEFPDTIEGLNFDKYDQNSAIIYHKNDNEVTSTVRVIFDSRNKLPSEGKFSFDYMREKYNTIGEISRLIVKSQTSGLNLDFKNLLKGVHGLFINNDIDITISGIKQEHYRLYSKFGGILIEQELDSYGELDIPFLIISWNPSLASKFFKRSFLG